jgi:hypothetical protein
VEVEPGRAWYARAATRRWACRFSPGDGARPCARLDEAFYILDGQIRFRRGDAEFTSGPGEFVFGPREVPHCFKVLDGGARALILMTPAGLEEMFVEGGVPAHEGMVAPAMEYDMERVTALAVKYGWNVLGPPMA